MRNGKLVIPEEKSGQGSNSGNINTGNGNSSSGNNSNSNSGGSSSGSNSGNSSSSSGSTTSTGTYVVNRNSGVFHMPSCPSVKRMNASNRMTVSNTSAQELKNAGYDPCDNCNPR